jgi:CRP/FNR family transcriptional regulator, cyclic AMP receptor protein
MLKDHEFHWSVLLTAAGAFFGEGCLTGQRLRLSSATAMTDCSVMRIEKKSMIEVLHREHEFSDLFVAYLLARNIRYEEDLVDQLFNSSEKRLARILLLLAHFGKEGTPEAVIPKMSQETLAEMIGTTRSRVSFFMNRFRKLGFIDYDGGCGLQVHSSLLNIGSSRLELASGEGRFGRLCLRLVFIPSPMMSPGATPITVRFGTGLAVSELFSYRAVLNSPHQSSKRSI